jgi:type IV pilus assembly protein PilV
MLKHRKRGVSLIEVLVAIVIFMVGLMGLLAGAARTIRTNQDAFISSHATNVANTYTSLLRNNGAGVIGEFYNGTVTAATRSASYSTACSSACAPADLAEDDLARMGSIMGQTMPPGAELKTECTPHVENASAAFAATAVPVYSGLCTITVTWLSDKKGTKTSRVWMVKP